MASESRKPFQVAVFGHFHHPCFLKFRVVQMRVAKEVDENTLWRHMFEVHRVDADTEEGLAALARLSSLRQNGLPSLVAYRYSSSADDYRPLPCPDSVAEAQYTDPTQINGWLGLQPDHDGPTWGTVTPRHIRDLLEKVLRCASS